MASRAFSIDELDNYMWKPEYEERVSDGRWTATDEVIFKADDDKFYLVLREEGLTEYQELEREDRYPDMDYTTKLVTCPEVEPYQDVVVVTKWREV